MNFTVINIRIASPATGRAWLGSLDKKKSPDISQEAFFLLKRRRSSFVPPVYALITRLDLLLLNIALS